MILIVLAWLFLFLLILSLGNGFLNVMSRITGSPVGISYGAFYRFWFGFAMLIGILQLISLFSAIGTAVFLSICLLSLLFMAWDYRYTWASVLAFSHRLLTFKGVIRAAVVIVIAALVAYSANREVLHTDTFIYHFNAVKWVKDYPVVPGLANLHSRLGFNSSFFLFAAFTEQGVFANNSVHIALSFLLFVTMVHWFYIISNTNEPIVKRILCLMTFLYLFIHSVSQIDVNSLSTDYPMAILTLIFYLVLIDKIDNKMLLLLPLAAIVLTFKLSGMVVVAFAFLFLLGKTLVSKYEEKNEVIKRINTRVNIVSLVLLAFIAVGFITRNVFVSGWLVYPFPVGNLHLPWSVPKPYVLDMIAWIKSYPKIPGGASPKLISEHTFFYWFQKWYGKFRVSMELNLLIVSFFLLIWSALQVSSVTKFLYARLNLLLLLAFSVASILFWFASAPETRFGSIYFFLLFATSVALLYEGSAHKNILKVLIFGIFIFQLTDPRIPGYYIDQQPKLFTFGPAKPSKLVRVVGSPPDEKPPLYIYMPLKGNRCGNSPLPCTPYAGGYVDNHRPIRQRVPGDFSKGFLPVK